MFVVAACAFGRGCDETVSAYFYHNKPSAAYFTTVEQSLKAKTSPTLTALASAAYVYKTERLKVPVTSAVSVDVSPNLVYAKYTGQF